MQTKKLVLDKVSNVLVSRPSRVDDDASENEGDDEDREQRIFVDDSFHIVDSIKLAAAAITDDYALNTLVTEDIPLK